MNCCAGEAEAGGEGKMEEKWRGSRGKVEGKQENDRGTKEEWWVTHSPTTSEEGPVTQLAGCLNCGKLSARALSVLITALCSEALG